MTSKVTLQAKKISQPKAGKRITNVDNKNIKSPSICRDGNANPAYHPWEYKTLNNFLSGKQIQCGRKSTYHCNLSTVKWIKGYRNTCPIAGCCGTFNRPAPLILSNFNFTAKKITKKIKISKINVQFSHKTTGVDVSASSGSEHKNWAGYFPYVNITLYKKIKTSTNTNPSFVKVQTVKYNKPVPIGKEETVSVTFTKLISSFNPKTDDLQIEINYPANGAGKYYTEATNPSIIYAKGLKIQASYDYIEKPKITPKPVTVSGSISGDALTESLITDPRNPTSAAGTQNCRNTLTHVIKFFNTTPDDIIVSVPDKVIYTRSVNTNNAEITYVYQDTSGIEGSKNIVYSLKSNKSATITKTYTATLYKKPTVIIEKQYIKNQKNTVTIKSETGQTTTKKDTFITISGNCWNNITIYIDGNKKVFCSFTKTQFLQDSFQQSFINKIYELSCGRHNLQIYIDGEYYDKIDILVSAPIISFTSNLRGRYTQNSVNKAEVDIIRSDTNNLTQPISVSIVDTSNTSTNITPVAMEPQSKYTHYIDLSTPGMYEIKCQYNDGCSDQTYILGKYTITPPHRQSYNNLFIYAKDNNVEYNSVVIRKGDSYQKPVTYYSANLIHDTNEDLTLFGKDGLCNIGELGYGILAIKNKQTDSLKNLCIELNPLGLSEDEFEIYDAQIMEWKTGMLRAFDDNFYILNKDIKDIVNVFNIQNRDLVNEGTENVVLQFTEIKPNQIIEVKIPYSSQYPNEIFMEFLLLGVSHDFVELDAFKTNKDGYEKYTNNNFISKNTKKIAARGGKKCISLSTQDAFSTELSITGDLDRNDLKDTDDLEIIYGLKIPPSECDSTIANTPIHTEIINDAHLIPTGYIKDNKKVSFSIYNDDDEIKEIIEYKKSDIEVYRGLRSVYRAMAGADIYLRYLDKNNNIKHIRSVTDNNGKATFKYVIPDYYQSIEDTNANLNIDTKERYYLEDILKSIDILYLGNEFYDSQKLGDEIRHELPKPKLNIVGFYYITSNNKTHYVAINKLPNANITSVKALYLVGRLTNQDNIDLNGEVVIYETKIPYANDPTKFYEIHQEVVTGDIPDIESFNNDKNNGYFIAHVKAPLTSFNLKDIKDASYLSFDGDIFYDKVEYQEAYKVNTSTKPKPVITLTPDYGLYHRGETINITVTLEVEQQEFVNKITLDQTLKTCEQETHIFYKSCADKNKEGWNTVFKTNGGKLLPNQVEENVYCNVDTDLKVLANLQKRIIENHNINILSINVINGYKPNKNVIVKGIIAPNAKKQRLGDYLALTAVDIDKDKYSYDRSSDVIYWNVGEMKSYETQKCNIILEAEDIGHNTIYVCGFDYLTPDEDIVRETKLTLSINDDKNNYHFGEAIPLKAILEMDMDKNPNDAIHDYRGMFGHINFIQLDNTKKCPRCNKINDKDATVCKSCNNDISGVSPTYNKTRTISQAEIKNVGDVYYAQGYARMQSDESRIQAVYDGVDILSMHYQPATSNVIKFKDSEYSISKYDTEVKIPEAFEHKTFYTNQQIQIDAYILYNNNEIKYCPHQDNKTIFTNDNIYFDKGLNIKFFVEGQEMVNKAYNSEKICINSNCIEALPEIQRDKDCIRTVDANKYTISFMTTKAGKYTIKTYIPETDRTTESNDTITINVRDGENNE